MLYIHFVNTILLTRTEAPVRPTSHSISPTFHSTAHPPTPISAQFHNSHYHLSSLLTEMSIAVAVTTVDSDQRFGLINLFWRETGGE